MKRLSIIVLLTSLVLIGAGTNLDFQPAPDPAFGEPMRDCGPGPICVETYTDFITQAVRVRIWDSDSIHDGTIVLDEPVTDPTHLIEYTAYLANQLKAVAETNLDAEVESGMKAVEVLREWSTQAMGIHNSWDSKSPAQKDALMKELFRRIAISWEKQADDYVTRGKGQ